MARTFFTGGSRQQVGGTAPEAFIKIDGDKEVERLLKQLSKEIRTKALLFSMMEGAEIIRQQVAANAPRPSKRRHPKVGRLGDNIIKMVMFWGNNKIEVGVLPDYRESKVGHLVEKGHKWWWGGYQEEGPFMLPAFIVSKGRALEEVKRKLQQEVNRTTKKLSRTA